VYCAVTSVFAGGLVSLTVKVLPGWSLVSAAACDPLPSEDRAARDEAGLGFWPLHPKAVVRPKQMKNTPFVFPKVLRCCCCHMSLRLSVFGLASGVFFRLIGGALVRAHLQKRRTVCNNSAEVAMVRDTPTKGLHATVP
jgi:hypothetical protein